MSGRSAACRFALSGADPAFAPIGVPLSPLFTEEEIPGLDGGRFLAEHRNCERADGSTTGKSDDTFGSLDRAGSNDASRNPDAPRFT